MINILKKIFNRSRLKSKSGDNLVAVMGADGKTTTVRLAEAVLAKKYKVLTTSSDQPDDRELNSTLSRIKNDHKGVVELDPRQPEDFNEYIKLFHPGTLIVTSSEYPQHGFQGDTLSFLEGVKRLMQANPAMQLILNWDDPSLRSLGDSLGDSVIFYGSSATHCHIWVSNLKIDNLRTRYELNYGVERVEVVSPLLGFQLVGPQLAAAALGINWGIPLTSIKMALEEVGGLEGRMEPFAGFNGSVVIDDTSKMSPQSMLAAIDTLNYISAKKRIVILSQIEGMAGLSERIQKEVCFKLYRDRTDYVYLLGEETKELKEELVKLGYSPERIEFNQTNNQIIGKLLKTVTKGDLVLLKTAKQARVSDLLSRLTKLR